LAIDAERTALKLAGKARRLTNLRYVADELATTDPERALRLLSVADRIQSSMWRRSAKAQWVGTMTLLAIGRALVSRDLDHAERIVQLIDNEWAKGSLLSHIAGALATVDVDRAIHTAWLINDEQARVCALTRVARALAASDPDQSERLISDAERLARSITEPYELVAALANMAELWVGRR
jgi:hypothetical protein